MIRIERAATQHAAMDQRHSAGDATAAAGTVAGAGHCQPLPTQMRAIRHGGADLSFRRSWIRHASRHPGLHRRLTIIVWKVKGPVLVHQLVAEIDVEAGHGTERAIVVSDAGGPQQHQQIRLALLRIGLERHQAMPLQSAFEHAANVQR
jgi:hypothetical protein